MFLKWNFTWIVKVKNKTYIKAVANAKSDILTPSSSHWFATFMMSFFTMSVVEPNFKMLPVHLCKTALSNLNSCDVGFM